MTYPIAEQQSLEEEDENSDDTSEIEEDVDEIEEEVPMYQLKSFLITQIQRFLCH